jgi:hypothetical protein
MIPKILHGAQILHDLLEPGGLRSLLTLAGRDVRLRAWLSSSQTGSLKAAALGSPGLCG